ncbi:TetR family transcriptional regulator [Nonomuraea sp. PA05]|uniref:TetR family transcriptional regulator n=1 Tax=Nonomuraea sp. PA05 TaxID=2604466 RepID=UPI0011D36796|nr:TetR family transcriptional regulator [Nonomuraea sp. PA05]TYB65265.1 TetR family transcriptional regulator [Nonomuraea sp. PA05]
MLPGTARRAALRPGPKPRLSREKIVKAAVELGIEQVSIGAVAAALGAAPASLYRYIDSLDDLVAAAVETVLAATPLPSPERGWRAYLEEEAAIRLQLLTRYAGLVPEGSAGLAGVAGRRFEQLVQGLVGLGFPVEEAVLAVDAVVDLMHDGASQVARLRPPGDPSRPPPAMEHYSPAVRAAVERIVGAPREHLARKLGLVLDGIAARRTTTSP